MAGEDAGAAEAVLQQRAIAWVRAPSPASAASAMRRSPGGRTGISRRMRPEEPPSSATVTTAVTSGVIRRQAAERRRQPVAAAEGDDPGRVPGPLPRSLAAQVAVAGDRGDALGA